MNIKLYFAETPKHWLNNDAVTEVWKQLYNQLKGNHPEHNFTKKCSSLHSYQNGIYHHHSPGRKFGFYQCIVENEDNGKYILLNYYDSITSLHPNLGWDLTNLVEIITTAGVHTNNLTYDNSDVKYTPSTYIFHSKSQNDILLNYKKQTKTIDGLYFRGKTYLFRKWLENDDRFNIITTSNGKDGISNEVYLNELSQQKLSLCLNGTAEITYRDIESFAVRTPVIRTTLTCKFHNELIPNYHYIAVDVSDIVYNTGLDYYRQKADRIHKRYLEVKDDKDFLDFITTNARKWFEENCTIQANVNILNDLIELQKLL